MKFLKCVRQSLPALALLFMLTPSTLKAQTDIDAIMMTKNNLCIGPSYSYSSWKNYWEGTLKRSNLNLGTVSTKMYGLMGTYGVTSKFNVIASAPYVETRAAAGTLQGLKGFQDVSLWLKWLALEKEAGRSGVFSIYLLAGGSLPLSNYNNDFLPMSIGLHSKTLSGRLLVDYQMGNLFATASATYTLRNDVTIDRSSYYTTEEHLTNKVDMPDMASANIRAGYRSNLLIAEAVFSKMRTLGGFDIRRNDMPFVSNRMNATMVGVNIKYNIQPIPGLSLVAGGNTTVKGRNVGQATTFDGAIFYILDFSKKATKSSPHSSKQSSKTN